ncbi:MAG: hypothetical protein ACOCZU_06655 [Planctomycetota bacterium]
MRTTRFMTLFLPVVLTLLAVGCASNGTVAGGDAALPANENSAAFLDRVSAKGTVSENDAARGLLMLRDGTDKAETFAQRVATLREAKIADASWDHAADRPITRGRLAQMVYQSIDIPGGVILTLTGPSQRYCARELQYRRMMTKSPLDSPVSGMEFVAVITRAATYKQTGEVPDLVGNTSTDPKE